MPLDKIEVEDAIWIAIEKSYEIDANLGWRARLSRHYENDRKKFERTLTIFLQELASLDEDYTVKEIIETLCTGEPL